MDDEKQNERVWRGYEVRYPPEATCLDTEHFILKLCRCCVGFYPYLETKLLNALKEVINSTDNQMIKSYAKKAYRKL